MNGRERILKLHLSKKNSAWNVDISIGWSRAIKRDRESVTTSQVCMRTSAQKMYPGLDYKMPQPFAFLSLSNNIHQATEKLFGKLFVSNGVLILIFTQRKSTRVKSYSVTATNGG